MSKKREHRTLSGGEYVSMGYQYACLECDKIPPMLRRCVNREARVSTEVLCIIDYRDINRSLSRG
jgi:hypothetical protein